MSGVRNFFRVCALSLFILTPRENFSFQFLYAPFIQPTAILTIVLTSSTELYEDDLMIGFFILISGCLAL